MAYIDPSSWSWPQWTWCVLTLLTLMIFASKNGQPREDKYNFAVRFVGVLISIFILSFGGFFA